MYKIINNKAPPGFLDMFTYVSGGTRNGEQCNLYLKKSKSHKQFQFLGVKCWNQLPQSLRTLDYDDKKFSKIYKNMLLEKLKTDNMYKENNKFDNFYVLEDDA